MKTYTYKANSYDNLYDLAEALAHDGTYIPRTISDSHLQLVRKRKSRLKISAPAKSWS